MISMNLKVSCAQYEYEICVCVCAHACCAYVCGVLACEISYILIKLPYLLKGWEVLESHPRKQNNELIMLLDSTLSGI